MGLGLVNAPRDESVPARRVFEIPFGSSLKKRDMVSFWPRDVSRNRRLEISVWRVRMLAVNKLRSHFLR